ncbi:MAG: sigma-70 family RNA polymerase sigma factor [Bryobacter sp.]|nr:sigma-70 family RNA polymerase sigma factor [Bryobacter sp.]
MMKTNTTTQTILVKRAQDGDSTAFDQLIIALRPRLVRTATKVLRNADEAEDVVQNAVLLAHRNLPKFRGEAAFSTWLIRIVVNQAIQQMRRARPETEFLDTRDPSDAVDVHSPLAASVRTPEEIAGAKEIHVIVRTCVMSLPKGVREPLLLRAVHELTHGEIGARLGLPENTVKVRIHRGRLELRRRIDGMMKAKGIDRTCVTPIRQDSAADVAIAA